ncbi:uncharacterized protein LOC143040511 [Oratosquilla oratoria]|uniref:uncharacterized protein LOC143040511 n=1 Tax=Oratosquilla oratoria TaxID=337810 RepID=UPI003F76189E
MACRFLLAVLIIIWGEQANGHELVDVNAACCGHYRQQRWDEYTHCVNRYGVVPACDGSRRGCYYGNQFFTVGETVAIIPEKCMKLVCVCITVHNNDDQSWLHLTDDGQMVADNSHTVQMKIVHVSGGCGCCQHDGEMFPNGTMKILDRSKCNISICVDGEWVPIQDDPCGPRNNGVRSNNRMDNIDTDDDLKTIRNTLHNPSFGDQELPLHGENTKDGGRMERMQESLSLSKYCYERADYCQLNCSNSSAQCHYVCQSDFDKCMPNRSDNARTFDGGVPENRIVYRRTRCCVYNLQHYFHGETIAIINDTYGRGCRKMYCYNSYIYTQNYECCCVEGNEVYSCYGHTTLPSSDHETCTIRKCCDGTIETSHEPGCCNENGIVYRPGAYLGYTSDYCHRKRCMEGKIIYENTGYYELPLGFSVG